MWFGFSAGPCLSPHGICIEFQFNPHCMAINAALMDGYGPLLGGPINPATWSSIITPRPRPFPLIGNKHMSLCPAGGSVRPVFVIGVVDRGPKLTSMKIVASGFLFQLAFHCAARCKKLSWSPSWMQHFWFSIVLQGKVQWHASLLGRWCWKTSWAHCEAQIACIIVHTCQVCTHQEEPAGYI